MWDKTGKSYADFTPTRYKMKVIKGKRFPILVGAYWWHSGGVARGGWGWRAGGRGLVLVAFGVAAGEGGGEVAGAATGFGGGLVLVAVREVEAAQEVWGGEVAA
jgi:hypothetical protein